MGHRKLTLQRHARIPTLHFSGKSHAVSNWRMLTYIALAAGLKADSRSEPDESPTMKAAWVFQHGGADRVQVDERPDPSAAAGQALVRVAYAGLNFVDIYQREGRFPGITLPWRLGIEGSGVIEAKGDGVQGFQIGDRVAFTTGAQGSYAEQIAVPASHLVPVPDTTPLKTACAVIEQGLTAHMLAHDVARLSDGQTVLVHAAAGGVGGLLVQMLKQRGLRVLGTASSAAKSDWLASLGVEPVRYDEGRSWADEVLRLTNGRGPEVVFDSVGATTFDHSLQVLAKRGHLVLFGAASGPVAPVNPVSLMAKSATLTRPSLPHYVEDPDSLRTRAAALFDAVAQARWQLRIHATLPLADAAQAQLLLASRGTQGKVLLEVNAALK